MISMTKKQAVRWLTVLGILTLLTVAVTVFLLVHVAGNSALIRV